MKLRGALIGVGNIAMKGHLPAYCEDGGVRSSMEIVAALDVVEEHRARIREVLPDVRFYNDIETLLDTEEIDFADICTPPISHAHYIRACAARGVHLLCEKPLGENYETAVESAEILRNANIVFVPCHQYKYSPLWSSVRGILCSGALGRVTIAQFNVLRLQADTGTAHWNPSWRTEKRQSGGGILVDTGAHYFYLVQFLFGLPFSVTAVLRTLKHASYGVEDTAVVTLDYDDMLVQVNLTWAASQRANSLLIAGTEGALTYDGARLVKTTPSGVEEVPMPNVADKTEYVRWYAALFREFHRRVTEKESTDDLLEESLNVMRLLDSSYRASERHRIVDIV